MDQHDHRSLSVSTEGDLLKRKQRRPKKDRLKPRVHSPAPGFSLLRQVESKSPAQDIPKGQPVAGIIEAVFDAGYLLNVKLSPETTLRGVVFKPGHYVPLSDENDVAPNAQLVRRNEFPIPSESQIVLLGSTRSDGKWARKGKRYKKDSPYMSSGAPFDHLPVIAASPISSRGSMVSVVHPPRPVNVLNVIPVSTAPYMPLISKLVSPFAVQGPPLLSTIVEENLNHLPYQHQQNFQSAAADSAGNLSAVPFQQLLDEVMKRTQSPLSPGTQIVHSQSPDLQEPLSVEPLQAFQPINNQSLSPARGKENNRTLEVSDSYQENVTRSNQHLQPNLTSLSHSRENGGQCAELGSTQTGNSNEDGSPGTDHGNSAAHSDDRSQTVSD